ncbi:Dehydration-responsive element-binding protein 1F [Acorus calamus]|uniref:Dehydration-responsive element-binding protein 1F n=1 Tax=Acorus calamus TaxID=4465 RepID=A0AAV9DK07_ACOCL|nr:Dehydration-responsive element-binding protein 1F [Acorus calamus]
MEFDMDDSSSHSSSSTDRSSPSHGPTTTNTTSVSAVSFKRKTGRRKFRETRHPVYRGVRARDGGRWVCEVREPGKKTRIWLGTYADPESAARAHDVAALAFFDASAQLNFPESARGLPRARSSKPDDIRAAVAEAATAEASSASETATGGRGEEEEGGGGASGFVDEEAVFNVPGLIEGMAEGMMLTPPAMQKGKTGWRKFRETRHPVYRGVHARDGGRWVCEVREPGKKTRIWLGTYADSESATCAHDVAALAFFGASAWLNFPVSTRGLPCMRLSKPNDIRFVDEEAVFNMPGLIEGMAEGMMLTPPTMQKGFDWDHLDCHVDLSLWMN